METPRPAAEPPITDVLAEGRAALARGDWVAARELFEAALQREETPEALEGLAAAAYWLADAASLYRGHERAYSLFHKRGDHRGAARVATSLAVAYEANRGESAVSNGWLQRASRQLEDLPPTPELAWLRLWEAHLALLYRHETAEALRLVGEARQLGRLLRLPDVVTMALALEGFALVSEGNIEEGMRRLDETTTAALAGELDDLEAAGQACCYVLSACEQVRDFDRALQWLDRIREFFRRWQAPAALTYCRRHYAEALMWRGAWSEAEHELDAMTREFAAFAPVSIPEATVRLAELRRRQGRGDEARALLSAVETHPLGLLARAALELDGGDATAAVDQVQRCFRQLPAEAIVERAGGLEILVRAYAAGGQPEKAAEALEHLAALAEAAGTDGLRAAAAEAAGTLAAAGGENEAAQRSFEDALDRYERAGAAFEGARTRRQLALVLRALGRPEAARREAQAAVAAFEKLGARHERDKAEDAADFGPARSPGPDARRAGLSPREIEVLRLVAEGLSNAEIAARLFLSEHTAKRHVANILTKLRLPSRAAAAAQAARLGV
jgi:LuxR family maltose regulon positive regulatory protein